MFDRAKTNELVERLVITAFRQKFSQYGNVAEPIAPYPYFVPRYSTTLSLPASAIALSDFFGGKLNPYYDFTHCLVQHHSDRIVVEFGDAYPELEVAVWVAFQNQRNLRIMSMESYVEYIHS